LKSLKNIARFTQHFQLLIVRPKWANNMPILIPLASKTMLRTLPSSV
jgi:hypothetical protein